MDTLTEFYKRFELDESIVARHHFNPYYRLIESGIEDPLIVDGRHCIDLASNNYLGLACDKRVKQAIIQTVERYGASMCGTPIATGYVSLYKRVEHKLVDFIGLEDALLLPSCYQTNNGVFSIIANKDDLIIVDHYAHSSLVQGIINVGCKIRPFLHNNIHSLEKILNKSAGYRQIFIVTESVFSTEGSIAPVSDMVRVCDKYNAILVIDDSHGIGVIGRGGRGILEEQSIKEFNGIYTASLGKAFANMGGVICGKRKVINYLRYYLPHLIYSTALSPGVLAGIDKVVDIVRDEFTPLSQRMWRYKKMITECLSECGYVLATSEAPITSIITGSVDATISLAKRLYEMQIVGTAFIPPSVPPNRGSIRLIAGAHLKEESLDRALTIFKNLTPS
ncbi:MAG: aminotransferase class I/II-fold pyridoxal phosphate-dependent enzyme [bacterium]